MTMQNDRTKASVLYRLPCLGLLLSVLTLWIGGCQTSTASLAEQRIQMRGRLIQGTLKTMAERERQSPANLAHANQFMREDLAHNAHELNRNLKKAGEMLEQDAREWRENQPAYRKKAGELFRGRPEQIGKIAVMFL